MGLQSNEMLELHVVPLLNMQCLINSFRVIEHFQQFLRLGACSRTFFRLTESGRVILALICDAAKRTHSHKTLSARCLKLRIKDSAFVWLRRS